MTISLLRLIVILDHCSKHIGFAIEFQSDHAGIVESRIKTEQLPQQSSIRGVNPNGIVHKDEYALFMPTLFTRILLREIPADIVYENEHVFAFRDIHPQAPVHIVIAPKTEITGIAELPAIGDHTHLLNAAKVIAETEGLDSGYRLVINQGPDGGQTVDHLHVHLLGGRKLGWPPG